MTSSRLKTGGLIDRTQPLSFTFDGKVMQGFEGDSLASALLANGQQLVGRSFKYHRPRGILTAGAAEPNALICFAGPRVIEQTIREKLPEGFQRAEYLLDHGMLDRVTHRKKLREELISILRMVMRQPAPIAGDLPAPGNIKTAALPEAELASAGATPPAVEAAGKTP